MKRKAILMSLMLMISLFGFPLVFAQSNEDVVVTGGVAIVSDMITTDVESSSVLGALISMIKHEFKRYIDYDEEEVWVDALNTTPEFTLQLWPADTIVSNVVVGSLFESSELISIRGTTEHVWDTMNAESTTPDGDNQVPVQMLGTITYDDGDTITFLTYNGVVVSANLTGTANEYVPSNGFFNPTCISCPLETELEALTGVDVNMSTTKEGEFAHFDVNKRFILVQEVGTGTEYFIGDLNSDQIYDFVTEIVSGFSVDSFETQVLAIVDIGTYVVYGQV